MTSTPPNGPSRSRFASRAPMDILTEELDGRVLFAIPKKGRLHEKCMELLKGADIKFSRGHRLDVCLVQNHPIALVFLPASDIPRFVALGNVSLGITGQDVILESTLASQITELLPLDFGKCALQVQVPVASPYQSLEQLAGKRIVTSFEVIAGELFKGVDEKAQAEDGAKTSVEYIGGSVEAACALGVADGIVDLVESGDTMRAAGLHAIHTILQSEAVLITSSTPHPTLDSDLLSSVTSLVRTRLAGVIAAQQNVLCTYNIPRSKLPQAMTVTPGRRAPTISSLETEGWVAVSVLVKRKGMAEVMDRLTHVGAEDILVTKLDNCRV
ncbi:atp phosphoribosyltransferase [Phaffia rhodozyma]|uniref:ATP phosphoribosyltransferase n=1 Tax=Phaffia rhodozyma TaxID=264483 RepID=A0A0F7SEB5_PHARH|nr:atp phosphoribosyltransferase [Phaffia rhodozyma]